MKHLLFFAALFLYLVSYSLAQSAGVHAQPKLITAYTQTIPQSKQSNPPMAGYFFVVKWEETTPPETFFWRGEGGWLTCRIEKACKKGKTYVGKTIALDKIRKGTQLLLTPLTGGRFPVPPEIPDSARNTLYYKTGGSGWIAFHVNKIAKK